MKRIRHFIIQPLNSFTTIYSLQLLSKKTRSSGSKQIVKNIKIVIAKACADFFSFKNSINQLNFISQIDNCRSHKISTNATENFRIQL